MITYIGGDTPEEQTLICSQVVKWLLSDSDWTQIPNNPLTPEYSAEWAVYRQQLRDFMGTWVPSNEADFPDKPLP
jgi:hypothetical protein